MKLTYFNRVINSTQIKRKIYYVYNQLKLKDLFLRDIPYTGVTRIAVPGVRVGRTNIRDDVPLLGIQ